MVFDWDDYIPEDAALIDNWLDDAAVAMTGLDSGWDKYWNEVIADSVNYPGCRDFCKLVKLDGVPIAAIVFGCYRGEATIAEIVLDPTRRFKGYGTKIIRELITHTDVWFNGKINRFCAVIFSRNVVSQKAFQNAGFVMSFAHDEFTFEYMYEIDRQCGKADI